jgi:hypothetical protein
MCYILGHTLSNVRAGIAQSVQRRAGRPGFGSQQCKIIHFFTAFRPVQPASNPMGTGVKRPGREADHSPPSRAEVKKGGAIPPLPHMSSWRST